MPFLPVLNVPCSLDRDLIRAGAPSFAQGSVFKDSGLENLKHAGFRVQGLGIGNLVLINDTRISHQTPNVHPPRAHAIVEDEENSRRVAHNGREEEQGMPVHTARPSTHSCLTFKAIYSLVSKLRGRLLTRLAGHESRITCRVCTSRARQQLTSPSRER